jgi:hypothetical protein
MEVEPAGFVGEFLKQIWSLAFSRLVDRFRGQVGTEESSAVRTATGIAIYHDGVNLHIGFQRCAHQFALRVATVIVHSIGENQ